MAEISPDARIAIQLLLEWIATTDRKQKALADILHDKLGITEADLKLAGFSRARLGESILEDASQSTEALVKFLRERVRP